MSRPVDERSPLVDDWRWKNICWYAYSEEPGLTGTGNRDVRLEHEPDAIIEGPVAVADWIEEQYAMYAPHTQPGAGFTSDTERAEVSRYRRHTNAVIAAHGQSLYIAVKNVGAGEMRRDAPVTRALYVEAVDKADYPTLEL